eukprot:TRINITY_DN1129_c0_g1_i6.p1 TRINITY_DN1129_c0_g1~~TRINITY_DN1129_c0_g1_i6.p1  ORF type:complete len:257 (-),score=38.16 TRINITY_DN1129_c0_g1_i6:164-934(-)
MSSLNSKGLSTPLHTLPSPAFSLLPTLPTQDTDTLNTCCSNFNSLLFLTPPKIRTAQDTLSLCEVPNEDILREAIPKDLMDSLEQDYEPPAVPLQNITNWVTNKCDAAGKRKAVNSFKFPEGGWVCLACQNYNFCGRVKCNRCGKTKTKDDPVGKPKHLLRKENDENFPATQQSRPKKSLKERTGNWLCLSCQNVNFSFRQRCNRCKMNKEMVDSALTQSQPWDYQKSYSYLSTQYDYQGYSGIGQELAVEFSSSM